MIDTGHFHNMIDVTDRIHQAGLVALLVDVFVQQTKLYHTPILRQGTQLIIRQVAVVVTNGTGRRVGTDHRHTGQLHHIPKTALSSMRQVDHDAQPVHLLHHLFAKGTQSVPFPIRMGRRVANIIVIRMAQGDVIDAHLLEFRNVGQILADTESILDTDEEGLFTLLFQTGKLLRCTGNATQIGIGLGLLVNALDGPGSLFDSSLQMSLIPYLLLPDEGGQEDPIEIPLLHLGQIDPIDLPIGNAIAGTSEPEGSVGMRIDRQEVFVHLFRQMERISLAHQETEQLLHHLVSGHGHRFRMVLYTQDRTIRPSLNRLHQTVRSIRDRLESGSHLLHPLMMQAVHLQGGGLHQLGQLRTGRYRYLMRGFRFRLLLQMRDAVFLLRWNILIKGASKGYIQQLASPANAQDGNVPVGSQLDHLQFVGIP